MKNKLPIFAIGTVLLLVFRILCNKNPQLTLIIALINLVALLVVVFAVFNQIIERINERINASNVPIEVSSREKKDIYKRLGGRIFIPLLILYVLYMLYWCSELGNDLISITALGLSLSDEDVAEVIAAQYIK